MTKTIDNILAKLTKIISPKRILIITSIAFILSVIPLIWIGIYNFPSADDFSYGHTAKVAFENGGLFSMFISAIGKAWNSYLNWEGCFFAEFLMAFPPHSINMSLYVLVCPIAILALTFGTVFLIWQIMVKLLNADKYIAVSIGLIISFLMIQCMPVAGRVEMLYWYTGVANYSVVHGLEMVFFGLLIRLYCQKRDNQKISVVKVTLISILGFFVGGAGLMTAFNAVLVLAAGAFLISINKKWDCWKITVIPAVCEATGFILNLIAPGNYARASVTDGMNPFKAIFASLYRGLDLCINEWTSWLVIVCFILMIPLFLMALKNSTFSFKYPILVILLGYLLTSASICPVLVGVGSFEAGRLQALTFFIYLMNITISLLYLVGWLKAKKTEFKDDNIKICIVTCILVILWGSVLDVAAEPYIYTYSSASTDILNGSAKQYYSELMEWHNELTNANGGDIVLKQLTVEPPLLYFYEIHGVVDDWANEAMARFYGVDSVVALPQ